MLHVTVCSFISKLRTIFLIHVILFIENEVEKTLAYENSQVSSDSVYGANPGSYAQQYYQVISYHFSKFCTEYIIFMVQTSIC